MQVSLSAYLQGLAALRNLFQNSQPHPEELLSGHPYIPVVGTAILYATFRGLELYLRDHLTVPGCRSDPHHCNGRRAPYGMWVSTPLIGLLGRASREQLRLAIWLNGGIVFLHADSSTHTSSRLTQRRIALTTTECGWGTANLGNSPLQRLSDIAVSGSLALHAACWRRLWRCCLAASSLRSRSAWISC